MGKVIDNYGLTSQAPLFHISSYGTALNSLTNKYIWFSRPANWKDPYEQFFYNATYGGLPFGLKGRCFIACFSPIRTAEAQWFIYGKGATDSLRFEYNKSVLLSVLKDFCTAQRCSAYIEPVEYKETKAIQTFKPSSITPVPYTDWAESDWIQLLTLKRNAYQYEHEVRIILVFEEEPKDNKEGFKLYYECENVDLINRIQLSPGINDWESKETKLVLEKLFGFTPKLDTKGRMQPTITQSRLYKTVNTRKY